MSESSSWRTPLDPPPQAGRAASDQLDAGMVGINQGIVSNVAAPFGGVKASGLGREGSGEGLEEYQEIRFYNLGRRGA